MLRLMLNRHPEVVVPPESWFLIDLMNQLPLTDPLRQDERELAARIVIQHRRWRDFGIPDGVLYERTARLDRPRLHDVVHAIYGELLRRSGKSRWGDKTPEYVVEIERLGRVFPTSQFIHLIRDARDVSLSLMRRRWRGTFTVNAARYWADYVGRGIAAGRRMPEGRYMEVHYEDIVSDPERLLRDVCAFLRLDYSDSLMQFHASAMNEIPPRDRVHHTNTSRAPRPDDAGRWRSQATWLQVMSVEGVAGAVMDQVGQVRHFQGWRRSMPVLLGAAEGALWEALGVRRRLTRRVEAAARRHAVVIGSGHGRHEAGAILDHRDRA